jgi:CheY-like chemotaxis protein
MGLGWELSEIAVWSFRAFAVQTGCQARTETAAKILFADDDQLMHRLYQPHMERAGFKVVEASNGREAVEAALRETPQLAVVDFQMPEMDGLSVVQELKRTEATRAIPVILISSDARCYQYKKQFLEVGASAVLMKPFSATQLLQTIQRVLVR